MSDNELKALPRVRPQDAAKYLQSGITAQDIRIEAQYGVSPYCIAQKKQENSRRYVYRINIGLLMAYKRGELGLHYAQAQ